MKKKLAFYSPAELADKLFKLREEIAAFEDSIKPLKAKEDELRAEMIESLKANRMVEFRNNNGVAFTRAVRTSYTISDMKKARAFLESNDLLKVDTVKLGKAVKGIGALPQGIESKETTYLSITGMKAALE